MKTGHTTARHCETWWQRTYDLPGTKQEVGCLQKIQSKNGFQLLWKVENNWVMFSKLSSKITSDLKSTLSQTIIQVSRMKTFSNMQSLQKFTSLAFHFRTLLRWAPSKQGSKPRKKEEAIKYTKQKGESQFLGWHWRAVPRIKTTLKALNAEKMEVAKRNL